MITENKIEDWHTLNAPFGFTDCEKSAWSVGYREGAEAVRNALATQAPTKFRVGDRIREFEAYIAQGYKLEVRSLIVKE